MENKNENRENRVKRINRVVYSMRLASYLMSKGYPLIDVQINKKYTDKKVFFFPSSIEIDEEIDAYIEDNKQ